MSTTLQKRYLTSEDLAAEAAFELPDRELMLITIVLNNVLNNLTVSIDVRNVNVAAQICATLLATGAFTSCTVTQ